MIKYSFILFILLTMTLVSCNEIPEDVKSRTEEQNKLTSLQNSDDDKPLTESSDAKPTGITIACKPDSIGTDKFYILKTVNYLDGEFDDADAKKLCEIMNNVFGSSFTVNEVVKNKFTNNRSARVGDEDWSGTMGFIGPSFTFVLKGDLTLPEEIVDIGAYELIRYRPDDYPKEKLKMVDGKELSIEDAINQTDQYIKELKAENVFETEEELKLRNVYIGQTGFGAELILDYEQIHYGLPLDDAGFVAFPAETSFGRSAESAMRSSSFTSIYLGSERPFRIMNAIDNAFAEKDEVEKILSFEEASKKLTDALAKNLTFTVNEAALKYCCYYTADADVSSYTYRPMWTFVLKDQQDRKGNLQCLRPRIMGYVDAVSGEVYYSDYEMHYIEKAE